MLYPRRVTREPASNASAGPASTTQEGRKKLRALKDRNTALMEELQRADEEGDKRQKLVHLQRQAAELKEKVELALTEKRPKLERVLGGSHDFMNLLEFGNLNKMHYQVDRLPPGGRPASYGHRASLALCGRCAAIARTRRRRRGAA